MASTTFAHSSTGTSIMRPSRGTAAVPAATAPAKISRTDAVTSAGNACAITAAFASDDYENLRGAFTDQLHHPFRQKLIPFLPRVIASAEKAGALGAFLSGSGSTICAVTLRDERKVGAAMQRATMTSSQIVITSADNRGVQISSQKLKWVARLKI